MSRKNVVGLFLLTGLVALISVNPAFAYGEQIKNSLTSLLEWTTKILGGIAVGFGLVFTGIKMSMGDEHALKTGLKIVGGGIVIFSSMKIVDLLQAIFK